MKFYCKHCKRYTMWKRKYPCPAYCCHCGGKLSGGLTACVRLVNSFDKGGLVWLIANSDAVEMVCGVVPRVFEVGICIGLMIIAYCLLCGLVL